jgi:hypothetical protein
MQQLINLRNNEKGVDENQPLYNNKDNDKKSNKNQKVSVNLIENIK